MARQINLNADVAEGFGAYEIGNDAGILDVVGSANIACGFHAGDPLTMHRVVTDAARKGVSIGAHPGFNDLWGFGRRPIQMQPDELEYMIAYQIGALQAIASYAGSAVTHVKAHGALYNMAGSNADYAGAIGRAIKTVDPSLIYVVLAGSAMERTGRELGLKVAREGFCDRLYEDDGSLTSRKIDGSVIKDPAAATRQAIAMARDGRVTSRSGKVIACEVETLCVHGDEPSALALARAIREGLEGEGIELVTLAALRLR